MDHDLDTQAKLLLQLLRNLGLSDRADSPTDFQPTLNRDVVSGDSAPPRLDEALLHQLGEIPAVQDRFHTLLKRRLLLEAERKPPLFPWEKDVADYKPEAACDRVPALAASVWMTQIRHFNLPMPMPEAVMTELLAQCQAVLFSSLREGAKLVRAVDSLFPTQEQLLNTVAGYVMVSPARSAAAKLQDFAIADRTELPASFDEAIETQQMALSLLAAREIISTLTLTVSPGQPQSEREWITELGAFTLRTRYHGETPRLRIEAELPCGGSLQFQGNNVRSLVDRDDAGRLRLDIQEFDCNQIYPLEVRLGEQDLLTFAIKVGEG